MSQSEVRVPLAEAFAYVHEPLVDPDGAVPFMGRDDVVKGLADRILHSSGGCFLVTGFRGVGKTTAVLRTLREVERAAGQAEVVSVVLNVARPMTTEQLLFEVVRRLFEALLDRGILKSLPRDTQRALILAYTRTSLSFKETRTNSRERTGSLELGGGALGAIVGALVPKGTYTRRRTDALAAEAAFLAYTDTDVEHDFLRIVGLLKQADHTRGARDLRLVVIVDELDKLTATPEGLASLEQLLAALKNLLTTQGIHFVFVGGADLHDLALSDAQRGNSVYESVFSSQFYVPCVWNATAQLLAGAAPDRAGDDTIADLCGYLDFKARGLPRLLLREFNALVSWDAGRAELCLGPLDRERVEFYRRLQAVVQEFISRPESDELFSLPIDEDRWRMGSYYVADWILRRRKEFTVDDILATEGSRGFDTSLRMSADKVAAFVECLAEHRLVDRVWVPDASHTMIGDQPQVTVYRLAADVRSCLRDFARGNEGERVKLAAPGTGAVAAAAASPWVDTDEHEALGNGRYELLEVIGRGGMGTVYRATDTRLRRPVAIKVMEGSLLADAAMRARFKREGELTLPFRHPNVVRTYAYVEEDTRLAIVMELVEGTGLRRRIQQGPMPAPLVVAIATKLLDALEYLSSKGIARCDLKPENVVLRDERDPVMLDFGIVRRAGNVTSRLTQTGTALGTPLYMSPEQATGSPDLDIRSDLYCLGLVMAEMLAGRHPRADEDQDQPLTILYKVVSEDVPLTALDVSPQLHDALGRALARDPGQRYAGPGEMRRALEEVPEAGLPLVPSLAPPAPNGSPERASPGFVTWH